MPTFSADNLRSLLGGAFEAVGYPADEAALIARLMVDANLCGHDSHGVRQLGRYLGLVAKGHVVAGATIEVVRETPTTAVLEANRALGHVAAARAVEIGVAKARRMRISIVGVRNLDHVGRVGAYPELAGVLTGAGSADVAQEMTNNGTLLITIDPEAFLPRADYERQLAGLAAYLRATATRPGGPAVELPGDFEARHRAEREAAGIEIEEPVWQKIVAAVEPLGLAAIPAPLAG